MRSWIAAGSVFVFACGGPAAPAEPTPVPVATVSAPAPTVVASAAPIASAKAPEPTKPDARFKVTMAMGIDGKVDDKALVAEANAQIQAVSACAPVVRRTDHGTGSLNLRVAIAKDGTTKPELQSPVSDDAKACILDAVKKWKLSPKVGTGSAMVLLSFEE